MKVMIVDCACYHQVSCVLNVLLVIRTAIVVFLDNCLVLGQVAAVVGIQIY